MFPLRWPLHAAPTNISSLLQLSPTATPPAAPPLLRPQLTAASPLIHRSPTCSPPLLHRYSTCNPLLPHLQPIAAPPRLHLGLPPIAAPPLLHPQHTAAPPLTTDPSIGYSRHDEQIKFNCELTKLTESIRRIDNWSKPIDSVTLTHRVNQTN